MSLTILIVDDEKNARLNISKYLNNKGYSTLEASTLKDTKKELTKNNADIVLLDAQLPDGYGPTLIEETSHTINRPPIIMITAYGDIDMAVNAMKNGAHDFFQKPIELEELEKSIERAGEIIAMRRELDHLRQSQYQDLDFVKGRSPEMEDLLFQAQRAAAASVSVLITGETGTGKEILVKAIHNMGPRTDKPFIAVNCAAIQKTMLESELFGHESGSFTGAEKRKHGLMEIADGGILFLDEISSMPTDIQAKLLRALEEQAFRRMGGTDLIKVDVQIIAASNRPLKKLIENNEFREDLYYRLKVVDLHMPTLRERKQDIPELVGFFIKHYNSRMGKNILDITPKALEKLISHEWPGNIRELRNVVERAMLFCDDPAIDLPHLPMEIVQ
ncbi:MAG: sigma-54-dependent Fis family transcriptional regulator [bacterium]|nr:MAG: sigma-54-dependent Fis family transcriptional regulator [bacterium]